MQDDEKLKWVFNPEAHKAAEPYRMAGQLIGGGLPTLAAAAAIEYGFSNGWSFGVFFAVMAALSFVEDGYDFGGVLGEGIGKHLYYSREKSNKPPENPSAPPSEPR